MTESKVPETEDKTNIDEAVEYCFRMLKQAGHFKKCSGEWEKDQIRYAASSANSSLTSEIAKLKEEKEKHAIDFLDAIREYERESHNLVGHDERTSKEFYDIFLTKLGGQ